MASQNPSSVTNDFLVPSTPPRKARNQRKALRGHLEFQTPVTPHKSNRIQLSTPLSTTKKGSAAMHEEKLNTKKSEEVIAPEPLTPECTPHRSPVKLMKRKKYASGSVSKDTILLDLDNDEELSEYIGGFLMPVPSTIGSGRQASNFSSRPVKGHDTRVETFFDERSKESSEDRKDIFFLKSKNDVAPFIRRANLERMSPEWETPSSPTRKLSANNRTPGCQVINDDLIKRWHAKSFNEFLSEDEDDEIIAIRRIVPENPFLNSGQPEERNHGDRLVESKKVNLKMPNPVDFSNYNEYINNKTGERKIIKLTEEEKKIKPKKLDFSSI